MDHESSTGDKDRDMDRVVADGVGGGVREQLVQQGVEFLTHPSVAQVGLGQRMRFLRNKGLSSEEVDEALVRAEQRGMTLPSTLQPRGQDRSSAAKVAKRTSWLRSTLLPAVAVVGAGLCVGSYISRDLRRQQRQLQQQPQSHTQSQMPSPAEGAVVVPNNATTVSPPAQAGAPALPAIHATSAAPIVLEPPATEHGNSAPSISKLEAEVAYLRADIKRMWTVVQMQNSNVTAALDAIRSARHDPAREAMRAEVSSLRKDIGALTRWVKKRRSRRRDRASKQDASASSSSDSDSGSGHGITTKSVREHFSQMSMSPTAATESHSHLTAGATASGRSLAGPGTASGRSLAGPGAVAAAKAATASPRTRVDSSAGRSVDTHTPGSTPAAGEEERKGGGGDGTAAAAAEPVSTKDRVQVVVDAVASFASKHSKNGRQLAVAANQMSMYLSNLAKQPNVPMYRRISTTNKLFKSSLECLEGHDDLLRAVGFQKKGSMWTWQWDVSKTEDNNTVLQAATQALQRAAAGEPVSGTEPEDKPKGSPQTTSATPAASAATASVGAPSTTHISGVVPPGSHGGNDATMSPWAQMAKQQSWRNSKADNVTRDAAGAGGGDQEAHTRTGAAGGSSANTAGASGTGAAAGTSTGSTRIPTFDEIVRMTEAGITPPGIRVVEDRTSSSPVVLGASGDTPVRKPWSSPLHTTRSTPATTPLPTSAPSPAVRTPGSTFADVLASAKQSPVPPLPSSGLDESPGVLVEEVGADSGSE